MSGEVSKSKYIDLKVIKKNCRELRSNMTESEKLLWEILRNRKFHGLKFLRQHPIVYKADYRGLNYFIADFYCHEKKAIIELDGPIHDSSEEYDNFRDNELKRMGIVTFRIKNKELSDVEKVLKKMTLFLNMAQTENSY